MADTIRTDHDAYGILERYRQQLIKKGQSGASFSDAIRFMDNTINRTN